MDTFFFGTDPEGIGGSPSPFAPTFSVGFGSATGAVSAGGGSTANDLISQLSESTLAIANLSLALGGELTGTHGKTDWSLVDLDNDTVPDFPALILLDAAVVQASATASALGIGLTPPTLSLDADALVNGTSLFDAVLQFDPDFGAFGSNPIAFGAFFGPVSMPTNATIYSDFGDYNGDATAADPSYNDRLSFRIGEAGGTTDEFVQAAVGLSPFWPGNPNVPVAGIVGLGILAGGCAVSGAMFIRRRKS
jgi:hypothetical protein